MSKTKPALRILVVTPVYPAPDALKITTPVVHYFTREWVRDGHEVVVVNVPTRFPKWLYALAKPFQRIISSYSGVSQRMSPYSQIEYDMEGVKIWRHPMDKFVPHGKFSDREVDRLVEDVQGYCKARKFTPDLIIGHWLNPSAEIICRLKQIYKTGLCLVLHKEIDFDRLYKGQTQRMLDAIDVMGFRSKPIKRNFDARYGWAKPFFYAFSGIPAQSLGDEGERDFSHIEECLYVGELIKRKHPVAVARALLDSGLDFHLNIIGAGAEEKPLTVLAQSSKPNQKIELKGRVPREEVFKTMHQAQVFAMVSSSETYGLVYLEAMAAGCITIASRNEGFDGIIEDGVNGFLCEAGNAAELASILKRVHSMPVEELKRISANARATAKDMTDRLCAERYLSAIIDNIPNA